MSQDTNGGIEQGRALYTRLVEYKDAWDKLEEGAESVTLDGETFTVIDDLRQRVEEYPLSVEVRSGWTSHPSEMTAEGFRIVTCTGGPHCEIRGEIDQHGEPDNPEVYGSDWFKSNERVPPNSQKEIEALEWFCSLFYFGE